MRHGFALSIDGKVTARPAAVIKPALLWYFIVGVLLLVVILPAGISAQGTADTAITQSGSSLIEQVYEHRISLLQDSLFITNEQLDASIYTTRQAEQRSEELMDSLILAYGQIQQMEDSLFRLMVLYDRVVTENRQNLERLSALSDSLAQSFRRENELDALNDSLLIILARTQARLAETNSSQRAYSDTVVALRNTLETVRSDLIAGEERVTSMYDQLRLASLSSREAAVDSITDERLLRYLQQITNYQLQATGLMRRLQALGEDEEIYAFKLDEFRQYLDLTSLKGHTPEALNLLAATYVSQDDIIRGVLAYLKTIFLFPDSEAAIHAIDQLEGLVERDSELGRLYYEVALNPDSVNVNAEQYYRLLNYLNHIRNLPNATARDWFIDEAQIFLAMYAGSLEADEVLLWTGKVYHTLRQFHNEILTYEKIRTLYPGSILVPNVTYTIAEITTNDLGEYTLGTVRYARFREEFPDHELAPAAIFAEATIYEQELGEYRQAGNLYRDLADIYPESQQAAVGLFRYAELLRSRLSSSPEAMMIYEEILSDYGQDPETGILALEGLATISEEMRQYDAAVVYYLDIHERYPEAQEQAVTAILQAADIYESQLNNTDATIHTLHLILDNYPDYPDIRSVQRRVQRLQN